MIYSQYEAKLEKEQLKRASIHFLSVLSNNDLEKIKDAAEDFMLMAISLQMLIQDSSRKKNINKIYNLLGIWYNKNELFGNIYDRVFISYTIAVLNDFLTYLQRTTI